MKNAISNKPYDDTFKSALVHCRQVVVPLVNEVFKTKYSLHDEIHFNNTELYNLQGTTERDVDTTFTVGNSEKVYHLECESTASDIVVRMFEYDTRLALQRPVITKGQMRVRFPASAVLYLRSANTTPDNMSITIEAGEKEISYSIPVIKLTNYSLDDIFAKHLYFLLPFYFFVYEKQLKYYNSNSKVAKELLAMFDAWMARLGAVDESVVSSFVKTNLYQYAIHVALALTSGYNDLHKEVEQYMGGRVSQYSPAEEMINKALAEKEAELVKERAEKQALLAEIARLKAENKE